MNEIETLVMGVFWVGLVLMAVSYVAALCRWPGATLWVTGGVIAGWVTKDLVVFAVIAGAALVVPNAYRMHRSGVRPWRRVDRRDRAVGGWR